MKKILLACVALMATSANAGIVVIANPNVGDGVTEKDIKKVFMSKKSELGGVSVVAVDQKEGSASRKAFYENVVGQSEDDVKSYRTEMVFTGKGTPPKEVGDDAAVKTFVATTPGGVGYIDESKVDGSVKVLMKK